MLVHAVNYPGRNDEHRYSVRTHGGALWRLAFAEGMSEVTWPSGTLIQVRFKGQTHFTARGVDSLYCDVSMLD